MSQILKLQTLCAFGCNVDLPNTEGMQPLHLAAKHGNTEVKPCYFQLARFINLVEANDCVDLWPKLWEKKLGGQSWGFQFLNVWIFYLKMKTRWPDVSALLEQALTLKTKKGWLQRSTSPSSSSSSSPSSSSSSVCSSSSRSSSSSGLCKGARPHGFGGFVERFEKRRWVKEIQKINFLNKS